MRVLVASSKQDFGEPLDNATMQVREKIGMKADVVPSDRVDWDTIKANEGGWDQAYAWASRSFDAIVLLETQDGGLGRGQFELAQLFLSAKKSTGVLRGDRIHRVLSVRPSGDNNWKSYYGVVEVAE